MTAASPEELKILLVLGLSFLIGLEREEHKERHETGYSFGGIRTFPLIGLTGYSIALLTNAQGPALLIGFLVIGILMYASYRHKLEHFKAAGLTSEISGLFTYLLGAIVYKELYWIAATLVVIGMLLLELKSRLESLARRIPATEILTLTKFLLLSVVILPILPDRRFTSFQLNPFKIWLIVVAISTLSYASYLIQRVLAVRGMRGNRGTEAGVLTLAMLGGAYSSTVATVTLAKRSRAQHLPHLFSGAILAASGVMYFRLAILLSIFSSALRTRLALPLVILGSIAVTAGVLWSRLSENRHHGSEEPRAPKNPLELSAALLFATLFVTMQVLTALVLEHLGNVGVYSLSVITGVTDVDPFIMSLTQSAGAATPVLIAAAAILIAAASNNLIKGIYALAFSDRDTGRPSFAWLAALALLGLLPILFLR